MANLENLDFYGNDLTGNIPAELGNLDHLLTFDLSANQLTGSVPTALGNLNEVTDLNLNDNQLTGSIPKELGSLANVEVLNLSDNQLAGSIPVELGNLASLQDLYLDENQLTGSIPTELGNLVNLEDLWLGVNQLSGSIPMELGNMAKLERILLVRNQLTGNIPTELGNLANLEYLGLAGNDLTGCIPEVLRDIPTSDLDYLGLYYCDELPSSSSAQIDNKPADGRIEKAENTNGVLYTFAASDGDSGDTVTWGMEGVDKDAFDISNEAATAGQLTAASDTTLNHEAKSSYSFIVKVSDETDADNVSVTLSVTDVTEPPGRPVAPTVAANSTTSLTVTWNAPTNTGPAITGYGVQYREASATPEASWTAPCPRRNRHDGHHRQPEGRRDLPGAGEGEERRGREPLVSHRHRRYQHGQQRAGHRRRRQRDDNGGRERHRQDRRRVHRD